MGIAVVEDTGFGAMVRVLLVMAVIFGRISPLFMAIFKELLEIGISLNETGTHSPPLRPTFITSEGVLIVVLSEVRVTTCVTTGSIGVILRLRSVILTNLGLLLSELQSETNDIQSNKCLLNKLGINRNTILSQNL